LGLALPVTGELSGTWGDTVNNSITSLLDSAVAGTTTLSADADVTLTTTTLSANQAREAIILWTAAGTVTRTITAPAQSKTYVVINKSSTQSIKLVGVGPTTGVTLVAGEFAVVAWNGTDFVKIANTSGAGVFTTLSASGTVSGAGFSAYLASPPAIGGTAAAAGAFTTLSASGAVTLSGGTANGVAYLNGSKVVTTGSALVFDGTNLGVGVTPSAWSSSKAVEGQYGAFATGSPGGGVTWLSQNAYYGASSWTYKTTAAAGMYQILGNAHSWHIAASGTAGNAITFTQAMTLDSSGNLIVGSTNAQLQLNATTNNGNISVISSAANANLNLSSKGFGSIVLTTTGGLFCSQVYSTTVGGTNRAVYVDNTGTIGYLSSVRASKTNIENITNASWLMQLNPVKFNYRKKDEDGNYTDEFDNTIEYGLIAEEAKIINEELCFYDNVEGAQVLRGVNYQKLVVPMLKAIQEQQALIESLTTRLAALEAK
jgi:hypothetical protein